MNRSIFCRSLALAIVVTLIVFGTGNMAGNLFAQQSQVVGEADKQASTNVVHIVVMDPLSAPLACDCVQGYAQRKYEKLAQHIAKSAGVQVKITWSESLKTAVKKIGQADLVIGKHSVVLAGAKENQLEMIPVAQLTNDDGTVHQSGLVVVRQNDKAVSAADLIGYRIFFGPADCEEKNSEPIKFIKEMGGEVPEKIETSEACSAAATQLMELDKEIKAAAIISSYAKPLLEGCGTIKKGDLRVIGETDPVPFITAFLNKDLDKAVAEKVMASLMNVSETEELLKALESKKGFVKFKAKATASQPKQAASSAAVGNEKKN